MDQTMDSALLEVHKKHGFCTAQSARTQVWQSLPSGDGAINQDTEHNTKEEDSECCEQRSTSPDGLTKRTALEPVLRTPTLLDLCTDDKTAQRGIPQDAQQQKNKGHGSTFLKHVFNNG